MTSFEDRLSALEQRIMTIEEAIKKRPQQPKQQKVGLPAKILELRNSNFFSSPQTDSDVHKKLKEIPYHCDKNRVAVALIRLQEKHELRRAMKMVDGKEKVAYVW